MTYKDLSVLQAFAFESAGFLQSMVFAMQHSLKVVGSDLKLCRFCHATYFQSKMFDKLVPGCIWMCALYFKKVLHGEIHSKFSIFTCMYLPTFAEVICKNAILSKYAAGQTQCFEGILHFKRQM